jgi:hypothetical protein
MALRNFMFSGSYSVVDNVLYSKQQSLVRFELALFENELKQREIRRIPYHLIARRDVINVGNFVDSLPEQPSSGDKVIVDFGDYATIRSEFVAFEKARVKPPLVETDENGNTTNQAELDAYTNLMDNFNRLKGQNKRIAIWDAETEEWVFHQPADETVIKCNGQRYVFRENNWTETTDVFDQEAFDNLFGISQMNGENKNVIALSYNWLKTMPECANTVDA